MVGEAGDFLEAKLRTCLKRRRGLTVSNAADKTNKMRAEN